MATPAWHAPLHLARQAAARGRFEEVARLCGEVASAHPANVAALLDAGSVLLGCGLLSAARGQFDEARRLAPNDYRPLVNLASVAQLEGRHGDSRRLYEALLAARPDDPLLWRNALTSLEYDLEASGVERLAMARAWGAWAEARAGGPRPRPASRGAGGGRLKVGYVSADFCQHTVGLFVKDVLVAHDVGRVEPFAYSAGAVHDWVTKAVRKAAHFRDVRGMDDAALADGIRADKIDVLVDLSGHTAGSRLGVFAFRPAPVQVSWLGYFSTTGLGCMDAVLLDRWHAPTETDALFSEAVVRLPRGRLCYTPVPFAPAVAPLPSERRGHITFGSFNNTRKLNSRVLALWARVLREVPDSRLVLKWQSFNDPGMRERVLAEFTGHGIESERIELRGPSFHATMLQEYGDIDIALDPFPFSGGLTSCEALWMGVPVVTWPQSRVVSRQTHAFLGAIGLEELSAAGADDYLRIAAELARAPARLAALRGSLRDRMAASPLCDVRGFTNGLEACLGELYDRLARA